MGKAHVTDSDSPHAPRCKSAVTQMLRVVVRRPTPCSCSAGRAVTGRLCQDDGNIDTPASNPWLSVKDHSSKARHLALFGTEGPSSPRTIERNFAACFSHANELRYRSRPRAPRAPASPDERASRIAAFTSSGRTSETVQPQGPSRTIGAIAG